MLISDNYIDYSQNGRPKADSLITFYMKDYRRLYGTLCFNNMIPVPDSEIINYDLNDEGNLKYKLLVFNELYFVRQNKNLINQQNIFNEQIEKYLPDGKIAILNSFPLFLYEYLR